MISLGVVSLSIPLCASLSSSLSLHSGISATPVDIFLSSPNARERPQNISRRSIMSSYRLGNEVVENVAELRDAYPRGDVYEIEVEVTRNLLNFKPEFIIRLKALNSTDEHVIDGGERGENLIKRFGPTIFQLDSRLAPRSVDKECGEASSAQRCETGRRVHKH
jgi:hypothetical protein